MKAIILAGGYAKRLWPLTLEKSKPLLDVGGEPLINHTIRKLEKIDDIDEVLVSTNKKFERKFHEWLKCHEFSKDVRIVVENTLHEGEKLGAIGGIRYVLGKEGVNDDCLVIAGDNVIEFDMLDFVGFFKKKRNTCLAAFDVETKDEAKKFGILTLDGNERIIDFVEKPKDPPTTLISICCYIFPRRVLNRFNEYITNGNNSDAPGFFLQWLHKKESVYAFSFDGHWFDIGDKESLTKAREFMKNMQKN